MMRNLPATTVFTLLLSMLTFPSVKGQSAVNFVSQLSYADANTTDTEYSIGEYIEVKYEVILDGGAAGRTFEVYDEWTTDDPNAQTSYTPMMIPVDPGDTDTFTLTPTFATQPGSTYYQNECHALSGGSDYWDTTCWLVN